MGTKAKPGDLIVALVPKGTNTRFEKNTCDVPGREEQHQPMLLTWNSDGRHTTRSVRQRVSGPTVDVIEHPVSAVALAPQSLPPATTPVKPKPPPPSPPFCSREVADVSSAAVSSSSCAAEPSSLSSQQSTTVSLQTCPRSFKIADVDLDQESDDHVSELGSDEGGGQGDHGQRELYSVVDNTPVVDNVDADCNNANYDTLGMIAWTMAKSLENVEGFEVVKSLGNVE